LKDVIKILKEQKEQVKTDYEKLVQQRQQIQTQLGDIATEMARLEGEFRRIEQLEKDLNEPKSK